jgi:hemin uptake protein HemP
MRNKVDIGDENNYRCQMTSDHRISAASVEVAEAGLSKPPERISSEALLGRRRELVIVHNGREYHLRLTQNGKLILTA